MSPASFPNSRLRAILSERHKDILVLHIETAKRLSSLARVPLLSII